MLAPNCCTLLGCHSRSNGTFSAIDAVTSVHIDDNLIRGDVLWHGRCARAHVGSHDWGQFPSCCLPCSSKRVQVGGQKEREVHQVVGDLESTKELGGHMSRVLGIERIGEDEPNPDMSLGG